MSLLAQAGLGATVGYWGIVLLIVIGVVGILYVIARAAGVAIPPWLVQVFWIVLAVVVGILAIKFIVSML